MNQTPGEWREYSRLVLTELKLLNEEQRKLHNKVDMILTFKWQIVGASIALSMILTIGFQVIVFISRG